MNTAPWVYGAAMGLISLVGLFLASGASDDNMYYVGLLFFVFGILSVFGLIGRHVGNPKTHDSQATEPPGHGD